MKRICTAFAGSQCIAQGDLLDEVVVVAKHAIESGADSVLIFDDKDGRVVDVDYRGTDEEVLERLRPEPPKRARGRPRLGVTSREVSLLPRQWEWLAQQPGGISVALRKLIDEARKANRSKDDVRKSQTRAYQFASAMAGDLPGFEEAMRALFANDKDKFQGCASNWPADILKHTLHLAYSSIEGEP